MNLISNEKPDDLRVRIIKAHVPDQPGQWDQNKGCRDHQNGELERWAPPPGRKFTLPIFKNQFLDHDVNCTSEIFSSNAICYRCTISALSDKMAHLNRPKTFTRQTQCRGAYFFRLDPELVDVGRRDPAYWLRAASLPGICRCFCSSACQRQDKSGRRTRSCGAFFRVPRTAWRRASSDLFSRFRNYAGATRRGSFVLRAISIGNRANHASRPNINANTAIALPAIIDT
jgi:hypothetical protein